MDRTLSRWIASVVALVTVLWTDADSARAGVKLSLADDEYEQAATAWQTEVKPAVPEPGHCDLADGAVCPSPRNWARAEYLLWWTKGNDLPALVTTGTQQSRGVYGVDGTQTLFGGDQIANNDRSGFRVNVGHWFDNCQGLGIEATYFSVFDDPGTGDFFAQTVGPFGSGDPILAIPFFNVDPAYNAEDALLVSFPNTVDPLLGADGSIHISSTSEMHSASLLLRRPYRSGPCGRVDLIGGYRYFRYREGTAINEQLVVTATGGGSAQGTRFDISDHFVAENDFHGGELGIVGQFWRGCWTLELLAKVAVGNVHREVTIEGSTTTTPPEGLPVTTNGGLLALPTNAGRPWANDVAALPELGINLTFQARPNLSFVFGYSLVMLNDVARTGEQMDRVVNATQLLGGTLVGAARPMSLFGNETDFWAQGINIGAIWER